jgi:hypothetical protein
MSTGVLARSLGDTRDASILIPGDAAAVRADARALDETAETLTTVADGVGSAAARGWTGKAASTFSETTAAMRTSILVAANAMGSAASALHAHASTLEWAQDRARAAIRSFDAAAACTAPDLVGTITPTAGQHVALASLDDARSQVHRSATDAAAALQDACVDAPISPGLWNQVGYQWSELWHGAAESFSGLGHLVWDHSTVRRQLDPDGTVASDAALAIGLVAAVKDPVQLGKDVIDYDTWATSPARAIGHLAPDAAIAAVTAGGGLVATRGASAEVRVGERIAADFGTAARNSTLSESLSEPVPVAHIELSLSDQIARAEQHLSRLDPATANDAMLARLRSAAIDGRPLHVSEVNFLKHEMIEAELMDTGMGWPEAHAIAGQAHDTFSNFHPEVIRQLSGEFSPKWREYWGIAQ